MDVSNMLGGNTIDLLYKAKPLLLLSYVAIVTVIVVLSMKRRKMSEHFQNLKREHLALCEELELKIALCSSLSSQSNHKARELTSYTLSVIQKHNVLSLVKNELKALAP